MKNVLRSKKVIFTIVGLGLAALLVACGGGKEIGDSGQTGVDPVAETERKQALGLFDKLPVSWLPLKVEMQVGLGVRQDVPITLTTTKSLRNARIVFVPDLRDAVSVSPPTLASLNPGESATVTLTFTPKATDTRKFIAGVVLLFDKNATVSRPLPVQVALVKPSAWPDVTQSQAIGVALKSPPGWISTYSAREELVTIKNVGAPMPLSEAKFKAEASFQIFEHIGVNPDGLAIDAWVSEILEPGLPSATKQKTLIVAGGRAAVRLVVSEMGGDRAHVYIGSGADVFEVAYGMYEPSFIPAYETMLASLQFTVQ